jgi:serine/threonine protein phosphatase PrpC
MGTLTLIGYKGNKIESQINQDRAFCEVPYQIENAKVESKLLGVFDGHAKLGEQVSQHTLSELPKLLATKLGSIDRAAEHIQALVEMFVQMDQTAPAGISWGCTASVVLQYGPKVYFANAGDGQSFLVAYRAKSQSVQVVYISREDKPDLTGECIFAISATDGMMNAWYYGP